MAELIQKILKTLRRVSPRGLEGLSREPFEEKLSQFFVSKLFIKKSDIFPCLHLWREYLRRCLAGDGLVGSLLSSHFLHPGFCTFSTFTSGPLLSFSSPHFLRCILVFSTPSFVSGIGMTISRWVAFLFPINQDIRTALLLAKSISLQFE